MLFEGEDGLSLSSEMVTVCSSTLDVCSSAAGESSLGVLVVGVLVVGVLVVGVLVVGVLVVGVLVVGVSYEDRSSGMGEAQEERGERLLYWSESVVLEGG